jgi:hypothetical protein
MVNDDLLVIRFVFVVVSNFKTNGTRNDVMCDPRVRGLRVSPQQHATEARFTMAFSGRPFSTNTAPILHLKGEILLTLHASNDYRHTISY